MLFSTKVELSLLLVAAIAIIPAILMYLAIAGKSKYLKGKILDAEFEMVKRDSYLLELEAENVQLKKELRNQPQAEVVSIKEKTNRSAAM
jgi:hypothetical protein